MFWFFAFIVVLVILLTRKSAASDTDTKSAYWQGRHDERVWLQQAIADRKERTIATRELRELLNQEYGPVAQTTMPDQVPLVVEAPREVSWQQSVSAAAPEAVSVVTTPVAPPPTPHVETSEEKEQRTVKNLNIMLYVGSFLIVAAAALFVTMTMPAAVKLAGVLGIMTVFYVGGLVLHARSERLRSAAIAFVGTGLAIVPFIGFALTTLGGMSNDVSWLVTSLVGVAAYLVAALRLQSELISYVTIAFIVSLALSTVPVLGLSVMWYFIAIIAVALMCNILRLLGPSWLPSVLHKPLHDMSIIMTPIALIASIFAASAMNIRMYEVLFGLATAHYIVLWLMTRSVVYELVVRGLAHVTVILVAGDVAHTMTTIQDKVIVFGVAWLAVALLQVLYSLICVHPDDADDARREQRVIGLVLPLMVFIVPLWIAVDQTALYVSINLALIAIICAAVAFRFRRTEWLYGTLGISIIVPCIVGRAVIEPALPFDGIALVFTAAGVLSLFMLDRVIDTKRSARVRLFCLTATVLYAISTVSSGLLSLTNLTIVWTAAVAALLLVAASYLWKSTTLQVVGALLVVLMSGGVADILVNAEEWRLTATVLMSIGLIGAAAVVHHRYEESDRRNAMVIVGASILASLVLNIAMMDETVTRASVAILLLAGIGALIARRMYTGHSTALQTTALVSYIAHPLLALVLAITLGGGWLTLTILALAGMLWASSYVEKQAAPLALGNGLFFVGLVLLWSWLQFNDDWLIYGVAWLSAAVYYAVYWIAYKQTDQSRLYISFISTLLALMLPVLYGFFAGNDQWVVASAGSLLMVAGVFAAHGRVDAQPIYSEAALYIATVGMQRMVAVALPDLNVLVYTHWWAITLLLVALWRHDPNTRMIIGLLLVTVPTGLLALGQGEGYTLVFLIEHLVIALAGALVRRQWIMWWGIVAVLVSILYFIRDYTVLMLLFLGLLLIVFVIWRLLKRGNSADEPSHDDTTS